MKKDLTSLGKSFTNDRVLKMELTIEDKNNKFKIVYDNGEWKGTPGTDGKETARLAIWFLNDHI